MPRRCKGRWRASRACASGRSACATGTWNRAAHWSWQPRSAATPTATEPADRQSSLSRHRSSRQEVAGNWVEGHCPPIRRDDFKDGDIGLHPPIPQDPINHAVVRLAGKNVLGRTRHVQGGVLPYETVTDIEREGELVHCRLPAAWPFAESNQRRSELPARAAQSTLDVERCCIPRKGVEGLVAVWRDGVDCGRPLCALGIFRYSPRVATPALTRSHVWPVGRLFISPDRLANGKTYCEERQNRVSHFEMDTVAHSRVPMRADRWARRKAAPKGRCGKHSRTASWRSPLALRNAP